MSAKILLTCQLKMTKKIRYLVVWFLLQDKTLGCSSLPIQQRSCDHNAYEFEFKFVFAFVWPAQERLDQHFPSKSNLALLLLYFTTFLLSTLFTYFLLLIDTCYVLSFAIIMLNTSLHNPNVKDKPGTDRFISMNRGINDGGDLPEDLLRVGADVGIDTLYSAFGKSSWFWLL